MKIVKMKRQSEDWLRARAGIPTASEFSNLVTPLWKIRTGDMVATYLHKKLAERWIGGHLPSTYGGGALEQGTLREPKAIRWYEHRTHRDLLPIPDDQTWFATSDDGRMGCTPDGMLDDGSGLEIKCPDLHTHCGYLLDGELPEQYRAQVQGSMLVTGAKSWGFLSFCPKFPPLLLTVARDEKAMEALAAALQAFNDRLDEGFERLVELNDGLPASAPAEEKEVLYGIV